MRGFKILAAAVFMASWTAKWYEMTTCEANKPRVNQFTGQLEYPQVQLAIACYAERTSKMKKEFPDRSAAEKFFAECDAQSSNGWGLNAVKCTDQEIVETRQ